MAKAKIEGALFFNERKGKFGTYFTASVPNLGDVKVAETKDGSLSVKTSDATEILPAKENSYGTYFVGAIGDKRYFLSRRTGSKGDYYLAKPAAEREVGTDNAGRTERPATYGGREA